MTSKGRFHFSAGDTVVGPWVTSVVRSDGTPLIGKVHKVERGYNGIELVWVQMPPRTCGNIVSFAAGELSHAAPCDGTYATACDDAAKPTEATLVERLRFRYNLDKTVVALAEGHKPEPIPRWVADAVLAQVKGLADEIERLKASNNRLQGTGHMNSSQQANDA